MFCIVFFHVMVEKHTIGWNSWWLSSFVGIHLWFLAMVVIIRKVGSFCIFLAKPARWMPVLFVEMFGCSGAVEVHGFGWLWLLIKNLLSSTMGGGIQISVFCWRLFWGARVLGTCQTNGSARWRNWTTRSPRWWLSHEAKFWPLFFRTYDKAFALSAIAKKGIMMNLISKWNYHPFLGMKFTQSATLPILVMGFAKLLLSPLFWGDEFAASLSMATTQILTSWQRDDVLWRKLGKAFLDEDEACFLWADVAPAYWWLVSGYRDPRSVEGHCDSG